MVLPLILYTAQNAQNVNTKERMLTGTSQRKSALGLVDAKSQKIKYNLVKVFWRMHLLEPGTWYADADDANPALPCLVLAVGDDTIAWEENRV